MEYDFFSIEFLFFIEDNNVFIRIFKFSNRIKVYLFLYFSFRDFMLKDYCIYYVFIGSVVMIYIYFFIKRKILFDKVL